MVIRFSFFQKKALRNQPQLMMKSGSQIFIPCPLFYPFLTNSITTLEAEFNKKVIDELVKKARHVQ